MSVPLYQAEVQFFRMPGHPLRRRVPETPAGRNELPAESREAEVVAR